MFVYVCIRVCGKIYGIVHFPVYNICLKLHKKYTELKKHIFM